MGFTPNGNIAPLSAPGGMTYGGIQNNWDALKEDFDAVAYLPFGDEYWDAMNQIMNAIGNREIAKQPTVRWFELTRQEVPFTVDETITIDSTDNPGTQVNLAAADVVVLDGSRYVWATVNEIYRHAPSGALVQVVAKDASTTPATLTLRPLAASSTISVTTGDKFFYVGVSVKENSSAQEAKFTFDELRGAKLQTMRHDGLSSSEALYNQLWYTQIENGVQTPYSNSRDILYLQREHQVAMVNTFLAGETDTNLSSSTSFQTTNGLIPSILAGGQAHDAAGFVDASDFYTLEAMLTSQDASIKNYMVWTTGKTSANIEQAMFEYNKNANISINKVQMEKTFWGEGQYADLMRSTYSFNNLVFNNKNFGLVRMGIFDNPQTFNVAGSNWADYAIFLPMSQGNVDDGIGNMGKYIRLCHKPGAFMNMWQTGGRAAANKTDKWELGIHIVSEVAFKFVNVNKYGMFYNATEPGPEPVV
jgi:hypothetical protein